MCFNQPMSGLFAGLGLALSYYVWSTTKNRKLTTGVFFFFTMEFLQAHFGSVISSRAINDGGGPVN